MAPRRCTGPCATATRRWWIACCVRARRRTAANRYGVTALPLACEQGDPAIVERLLKAGVSANLTGPLGETALHTCARSGHVAAAKVLVTRGASL